jgi:hypothetical protein
VRRLFGISILVSILLLASCNIPVNQPEPTADSALVATMAGETLSVLATRTPLSTFTPALPTDTSIPPASPMPTTGKAAGKVCYPPKQNTEMRAFFQETSSGKVNEMAIAANVSSYEVVLDPGTYTAYVWLNDFSRGGLYSDGKSPLPFSIVAGQTATGIDLCDWTVGPFDVPYPPGYDPKQTTGSISGSISYSYGDIPQLTVVAFNQSNGYWYWVGTASGQNYYNFDALPPGKYQVVAYDGSHAGGSEVVTVAAGQTATANVTDWGGSFPANPVK